MSESTKLSSEEQEAAKVLGMTPAEYADMKGVRTQADFAAVVKRREENGEAPLAGGRSLPGRQRGAGGAA
jgi:hypothetical protein